MINFINLNVGQRLALKDGREAEVVGNIGDGIWVQVRFDDCPDDEELLHCEEVVGLAE
ncbi:MULTISPECIES: hypothetical protein [Achromobacter]|uniref:Uncharacterized protein n=1 Tax=Achromobacter kerstersii TaxID=1353890 RepID=A0A6S6Z5Q6_9BURK|nr:MULTISPECIES: hypothetical protein [Achromobacter]MDX3985745.1 hypothetical protein [Achromobacter sp.]CAB3663612.1 hypothetical protein LMG3441_00692 [Achromobacter kerstersii]